jgi:hypothetical protein
VNQSNSENLSTPVGQTMQDQPLGLTVHNMPAPGETARHVSGRWKLFAILLVCVAPVVASYLTYYVIRPEGRRNYGDLITPQIPLPAAQTTALSGKSVPLKSLKGQWLLVSVASAECDAACVQRLYLQRQLREALGREKDRLDWVWLVTTDAAIDSRLQAALTTSLVLRIPIQTLSQWLVPAAGQRLEDHLYLIDPLGNWMMRFPANMDVAGAAKAKRDIDRLLRASSSWDKEGRDAR